MPINTTMLSSLSDKALRKLLADEQQRYTEKPEEANSLDI
jgi:hypothetical protein